jgi:gamma-glutamyltranspeptidase/glutathione hydrolase
MRSCPALLSRSVLVAMSILMLGRAARADRPHKPVLHGQHWVAITGKPLGAQAGAMMFQRGGNAVDATCAMLAAVTTLWDTLSWGGETQALIYDPTKKKVVGINALGVAPTGATPELFKNQNMKYPPEFGPLAAVTPGTPGGLFTMLAEFGTMSLADVLAPAIQLADGYPIETELSSVIERNKAKIKQWPYAKAVMLPHLGQAREAPAPGEIFRQPDLAATLRKLVEAEAQALQAGKNRKQAIYAAYDRFYKGDIAAELVRSVKEQGGLFTMDDLAKWQVRIEEPVSTTYRGIAVYKLTTWVQGPAMLLCATPPSVETNTSLGMPVSEVPTQTVPSGPRSSASIQRLAIRPGALAGSSAVAVAKLQPPSRLTRRPVYVVAKIVPSPAIAYAGSHRPP